MSSKRKYSAPRPTPNNIRIQWGKVEGCEDICMCWGNGAEKATANLLMHMISSPRHSALSGDWEPSIIEELEMRGYDIKTLKISVCKVENEN